MKLVFGFMYGDEFFKEDDYVEVKGIVQGHPDIKCNPKGFLHINTPSDGWIGIRPDKKYLVSVPVHIDSITMLKHIKEEEC